MQAIIPCVILWVALRGAYSVRSEGTGKVPAALVICCSHLLRESCAEGVLPCKWWGQRLVIRSTVSDASVRSLLWSTTTLWAEAHKRFYSLPFTTMCMCVIIFAISQ